MSVENRALDEKNTNMLFLVSCLGLLMGIRNASRVTAEVRESKFCSSIRAKPELLNWGNFTGLAGNSITSPAFMQFVYVKSCPSRTRKNSLVAFVR